MLLTVARMAEDADLRVRCIAALQGLTPAAPASALESWWWQRRWRLCASPGWAQAWESAAAAAVPDPGASAGVITDGDIVAAISGLINDPLIGPPEGSDASSTAAATGVPGRLSQVGAADAGPDLGRARA